VLRGAAAKMPRGVHYHRAACRLITICIALRPSSPLATIECRRCPPADGRHVPQRMLRHARAMPWLLLITRGAKALHVPPSFSTAAQVCLLLRCFWGCARRDAARPACFSRRRRLIVVCCLITTPLCRHCYAIALPARLARYFG